MNFMEMMAAYHDGKGLIYISSDGNLYWNDWKENAGADCVFMK